MSDGYDDYEVIEARRELNRLLDASDAEKQVLLLDPYKRYVDVLKKHNAYLQSVKVQRGEEVKKLNNDIEKREKFIKAVQDRLETTDITTTGMETVAFHVT
jgi:transposase-like protein